MRRAIALLALLTLFACHRKPAVPLDVIAKAGDRMLTISDFKRYIDRNAGSELAQLNAEVSSALLDQYVEEVVISEYAAAHGIEVPAEQIAAAVRNDPGTTVMDKRDEMRRQRLLAQIAREVGEPDPSAVRNYYAAHPAEFKTGEEVRARQILVRDENVANEIDSRLRKGEEFQSLSSQYSLAPNAKKGGDIGYVSRGELPKMFEDVIFGLKPGDVSDVIRTDSTFHIFQVYEHRPPGTIDFATAEPMIRQRMRDDAVRNRMAELASRARADEQINVLTRRLPFRYRGTLPTTDAE